MSASNLNRLLKNLCALNVFLRPDLWHEIDSRIKVVAQVSLQAS